MYKECTKNLKKGTSILSSSTPTAQGKVANQPGSQGFLNHTYPELSVARATLVSLKIEENKVVLFFNSAAFKNKCGSGHRKLRVCVVKNPYCSNA